MVHRTARKGTGRPERYRCPHCTSNQVERHGTFRRRDGSRQQRYLCRACGRTSNRYTGTPISYIKKRDKWGLLAKGMAERLTIRQMTVLLGVHMTTSFRWRHRVLSALACHPQERLVGNAGVSELFVRYSEKGSWYTDGPGARKLPLDQETQARRTGLKNASDGAASQIPVRRRRFRRFIDGKPSCVLFFTTGQQRVTAVSGQGRPSAEVLQKCLSPLSAMVAQFCTASPSPFGEACRALKVPHLEGWGQKALRDVPLLCREASGSGGHFHFWLRPFHGIATRYLENYLTWFRKVEWVKGKARSHVDRLLLSEALARPLLRPVV